MLIDELARQTGMSKTACKDVLETLLDVITGSLKQGEEVALTGFGTFKVQDRKSRTGRNPATGKKMVIPAKRVPRFVAGKNFKEVVAAARAAKR